MKILFTLLCVLAYFKAGADKPSKGRDFFMFIVGLAALLIWFVFYE